MKNPKAKSTWQEILNGKLKIGHKPGGRSLSYNYLHKQGTEIVVTLLNENEGAKGVGEAVERLGMQWIWLPMQGTTEKIRNQKEILETAKTVKIELEKGRQIYNHCSAGLHRTGIFAYLLLLVCGYNEQQSCEILSHLRPLTFEELLKKGRKEFVEQIFK